MRRTQKLKTWQRHKGIENMTIMLHPYLTILSGSGMFQQRHQKGKKLVAGDSEMLRGSYEFTAYEPSVIEIEEK